MDGSGLLYYHARYYDPTLARFVSADTVVPGAGALTVAPSDATAAALFAEGAKDRRGHPTTPQNPQALNRYSYVQNNPLKYTDSTGHCFWDACVIEGAAAYAALTAALTAATYVGIQIYNIQHPIVHQAETSEPGKPLTPDEEVQIKRVGSVPDWLKKHPDLEQDAEAVRNGETLPEGADHVGEAGQQVEMLDKAIRVLEKARKYRDAEGQAKIDEALGQAKKYRQQLNDILHPQ